jgi:hypothetical protein
MPPRPGRLSPLFALTAPLGLAAIAVCGVAYGAAAALTPWAVTNPLVLIALLFAIAYISIQAARLGKLRSVPVAWAYGFAGLAAFTAASAFTLQQFAGHTGTLFEFLADRRRSGVTLFGSVTVKGGWLIACWVVQALLVLFAAIAPLFEVGRPFCEACRSWAWKPRWTFRLVGPAAGALARLKQEKSIDALIAITQSGGASSALLSRLGVCRCGALAALNVELRSIKNGSEDWTGDKLIEDLPIYPATAERLYRWAEAHDPAMAGRRPKIEPIVADDAPLDLELPDGEPHSTFRWSGSAVAYDSGADNAFTRALRREIKRRGFEVIPGALAMARNHDELAYIAEACADWDGRPEWLERGGAAQPDRPEMLLIRGMHSVKWAWQARGGGWVPKHYGLFQQRLIEAEQDLYAAAEARPDDSTPWAWLIYAGKGRQHEKEALLALFKEAIRRAPYHRAAHSILCDAFTPKWGGSAAKLHEFATKASARAPAGSPMHAVVAEAHLELAHDVARETEDKRAFDRYLHQPHVQADLRRANARAFRIGDFRPGWETPRARAFFAYTLWKAGLRPEAAEHLRIIGRRSPWGVFQPNLPGMKDSLRAARRQCAV